MVAEFNVWSSIMQGSCFLLVGFVAGVAGGVAGACVALSWPLQSSDPLILEQWPAASDYGEEGWLVSGGGIAVYAVYPARDVEGGAIQAWQLAPILNTYGRYGTWMRVVDSSDYIGKRVRISAKIRTEGATRRADFWARVQGPDSLAGGPGLGGDGVSLEATSNWTSHSIVMDIPEGGDRLEYGVGLAGPGSMWFEPLELEVVGPGVPLTVRGKV